MTVPKGVAAGFFLLLWSFAFAHIGFSGNSSDRNIGKTANPHTEDAECPSCHRGPYREKEGIDQNLCYVCHRLEKYRTKRYKHSLDKGCLSCHQNHRPKAEPLLKGDPIDVCAACHDAIVTERTHPLRVKDPNTGEELTCTSSCHDVHGTDFKFLCKLEPGRELCISCHEDLK